MEKNPRHGVAAYVYFFERRFGLAANKSIS